MLSDDQLIDEVRRALQAVAADVEPRQSTLDRVRQEVASPPRRRRPRWPGMRADAIVVAATIAITVAVTVIAFSLQHAHSARIGMGYHPRVNEVAVGSARLLAQASDPRGGLRWGLRTVQTGPREACLQVGRVKNGRIGVLGQNGAYANDGRFHPISTRDNFPCAQTDANNYLFLNVLQQQASASGPSIGGHGGCIASERPGSTGCPTQATRNIAFGMLGPEAASITYSLNGHTIHERTGPGGAYIAVVPGTSRVCSNGGCTIGSGQTTTGTLHAGLITSVTYRNGSVCRLAPPNHRGPGGPAPTQSAPNTGTVPGVTTSPYQGTPQGAAAASCPALGYHPARFHEPHPTAGQVSAPMTVKILTAKRYCYKTLAFGSFLIPCDHAIPHGYKPAFAQRRLALVDISFTARVAADNHHSVYEYTYGRVSGPANCTANTGGTSATTMLPVHAGQRVTIQDDQELCPGTYAGIVTYQPNGAPGRDTLDTSSAIHDHSILVGRFTYTLPK